MEIRLFDAAGPTSGTEGLNTLGEPNLPDRMELESQTSDRTRFAGLLDSPFQTYAIDYFGDLDSRPNAPIWKFGIERFSGLVSETREYFDGKLAVKTILSPDVRAQQFGTDSGRRHPVCRQRLRERDAQRRRR